MILQRKKRIKQNGIWSIKILFYIEICYYNMVAELIVFAVLTLFIGCFLACILPVFVCDFFEEYRQSIRSVIILLDKKGYAPQQILSILSFYNSQFLQFRSSESLEILIPLTWKLNFNQKKSFPKLSFSSSFEFSGHDILAKANWLL